MHHNDVGLSLGEPAHELVLPRNIRGEEPTVALVLPVVGEATTLTWQCPDKVRVLNASVLELLPEEGSPASLLAFFLAGAASRIAGRCAGLFSYRTSGDGVTQRHDLDFDLGVDEPSVSDGEGY